MTTVCVECRDDLAHCHAAWIRHPDGHEECLVLSCQLGPDSHEIIVLCHEVDADCCG